MAGQLGDFKEHHFPPCTARHHPRPPTHLHPPPTHTNNSLAFTPLPDEDSTAKTPPITDNSNGIKDKKPHMLDETKSVRDEVHISPNRMKKVTLKDKMGVG